MKPYYKIFIIFALALIYSYLRYIIFSKIRFDFMMLYVTNKAFALSAVSILFFKISRDLKHANIFLNVFIALHISVSIFLLNPEHFDKLYIDKLQFTVFGLLFLLSGILAATFWISFIYKRLIDISLKYKLLAFLFFVMMHNLLLGFSSWINYSNWVGYLPPITLISFLFNLISVFIIAKKKLIFT